MERYLDGRVIRAHAVIKGWSDVQLASRVEEEGVHVALTSWGQLLSGNRPAREDIVAAIAKVLGVRRSKVLIENETKPTGRKRPAAS